jgi:hypothetical protein
MLLSSILVSSLQEPRISQIARIFSMVQFVRFVKFVVFAAESLIDADGIKAVPFGIVVNRSRISNVGSVTEGE